MDNEMIERCASAITESRLIGNDSSIDMTLACIKAMREPTDKMTVIAEAHRSIIGFDTVEAIYTAMIDAIIND